MKRLLLLLLLATPLTLFADSDAPLALTLEDAFERALTASETIDIVRRDQQVAALQVDRAWTIVTPRLYAVGRYERPQEEIRQDDAIILPADSQRAIITVEQPLFDGRVPAALRGGRALESAAQADLAHTIQTILYDVSQAYYAVLQTGDRRTIADQTAALAEKERERAQARFDAGEARRTELLRAEVDLARAQRNVVAARNALEIARSRLCRLLGLSTDTDLSLTQPPPRPPLKYQALAPLVDLADTNRADLAAARQRLRAADAERIITRRDRWPTVSLQYNHQFVDPETNGNLNDFWNIAAVAQFSIWDGGAYQIDRKEADLAYTQASLRVQALEQNIALEVQQALLDMQTAEETLATLETEVSLAEENYRTLSEQARVGLATSLDVSTALTALDSARVERSRSAYDLELAKQRVEATIGLFAEQWVDAATASE
jgi:outer membrane protein TolC